MIDEELYYIEVLWPSGFKKERDYLAGWHRKLHKNIDDTLEWTVVNWYGLRETFASAGWKYRIRAKDPSLKGRCYGCDLCLK